MVEFLILFSTSAYGFTLLGKYIDLMDSDGFIYVTHKGKKKHKKFNSPQKIHINVESSNFNKTKLKSIQDELKVSEFYLNFKEKLDCVHETWSLPPTMKNIKDDEFSNLAVTMENVCLKSFDLICYGLGKFSSCLIARYQLAFLVILKDVLKPDSLHIYDPVFSKEEISILNELGMEVIEINEEAKRKVDCKTIFFMPHCDLPLYNNLLWANWNKQGISKLIIIGNSLQNYKFSMTEAELKEKAHYVYLANSFMSEEKIANQFRYPDIFNDISIHYFKSDALSNVPDHVWNETSEPVYSENLIKSV